MGRTLKIVSLLVLLMAIVVLVVTLPLLFSELDRLADMSVDDAMQYTGDIYYATQQYLTQRNPEAPNHTLLVERHYLEPDSITLLQWEFSIHWPDSIVAVSTNAMPGGPNQHLRYDIENDEFYGFSLPSIGFPSDFR